MKSMFLSNFQYIPPPGGIHCGCSDDIGDCNAQPGQYVDALVDQKVKDRAAAMNPTS